MTPQERQRRAEALHDRIQVALWKYPRRSRYEDVLAQYPLIEPEVKVRLEQRPVSRRRATEAGRRRINARTVAELVGDLQSSNSAVREAAEAKLRAHGYVITDPGGTK